MVAPRAFPSVGGVQTHVHHLSRELGGLGITSDILAPAHDGALPLDEMLDGVRYLRVPQLLNSEHLGIAPAIGRVARQLESNYDLLHVHGYHATPALFAASAWRKPIVFTPHFHGSGHSAFRRLLHHGYRFAGTRLFSKSAAVVAVSSAERRLLCASFPVVSDRISVVSNGVSVDELRSARPFAKSEVAMHSDSRVVLFAGRLETYKRVDRVVRAFGELPEGYELVIVGDGTARRDLESLAQSMPNGRQIRFLGQISTPTLRRWTRTASVFASFSEHEAQSIVLLEALAIGLPAVASRIPAHESVASLAPDRISLVDAADSPSRVAAAVMAAATLPSRPVEVPTWRTVAQENAAIYRSVLEAEHSAWSESFDGPSMKAAV